MPEGSLTVRDRILTESVPGLVCRFALPTILTMMMPAVYNIVSTYFVAGLGVQAVAALGVVFALHCITAAIGIMTGQGVASFTSRLLGSGEPEKAGDYASAGLVLSLAGGLIYLMLGECFLEPMLAACGATPTIMPYAVDYSRVFLLGGPAICASFTLNNFLRSEGLARIGTVWLTAGGIVNLILTPLMILGLDMGIAGAAWATVIAQTISFAGLMSHYLRGRGLIQLHRPALPQVLSLAPSILGNGTPSLMRNLLAVVAASALNLIAGGFGDEAVAAISIVGRTMMIVNAFMVGLGQGYQPVLGFNWGAGQYARAREAMIKTVAMSTAGVIVAGIAAWFWAPAIVRFFDISDPNVIAIGALGIRCQAVALPFIPLAMIMNMTYQVLGQPRLGTLLASLRQGLFFFPLVLILPSFAGITGLVAATPASDILSGIVCLYFAKRFIRITHENAAKKAQEPV